jgi:hypothetical protein
MKRFSKVLAMGLWVAAASALSAPATADTDYSHLIVLIKDDGSRLRNFQDNVDPSSTFQHHVPNIKPLVPPPRRARWRMPKPCIGTGWTATTSSIPASSPRTGPSAGGAAQARPRHRGRRLRTAGRWHAQRQGRSRRRKRTQRYPDYTERQNYLFGRSAVAPYKIGGVNAVQAWKVPGGKGENMRVISSEIDHWSYDHADLPKPFLEVDAGAVTGYHDTASVGTIASKENAFGTTGIALCGTTGLYPVRLGPPDANRRAPECRRCRATGRAL